jgi:hypothetical protein
MAPPSDLSLSAECFGGAEATFLSSQHGRGTISSGSLVAMNVAKQETHVGEQFRIDSEEFATLPKSLPSSLQQCLDLPVDPEHLGEDDSGRLMCVILRSSGRHGTEVFDRGIARIGRPHPGG